MLRPQKYQLYSVRSKNASNATSLTAIDRIENSVHTVRSVITFVSSKLTLTIFVSRVIKTFKQRKHWEITKRKHTSTVGRALLVTLGFFCPLARGEVESESLMIHQPRNTFQNFEILLQNLTVINSLKGERSRLLLREGSLLSRCWSEFFRSAALCVLLLYWYSNL